MKLIQVAIYLQDYYSEEREKQSNNEELNLLGQIKKKSSWIYAATFKDSDRNYPSYHLEKLVREVKKESIDIILVGSLSKFHESLNHAMDIIDQIVSMGIRIVFFEEGIDSGTAEGKMLLEKLKCTLAIEKKLASVNRKWAYDSMFEKGTVIFSRILGYKKIDSEWVIIPEEAEIIREVFRLHLEGLTLLQIARRFIAKQYKKTNGRKDWTSGAIKSIIKNERYTGDVLCRKNVSDEDVALTIKKEQYLIRDHHEAIISREDYEKANKLLWQGFKGDDRGDVTQYPLSKKLKCELCGSNFQRYQNRDKVFWRCGTHIKSKSLCSMTSLKEELVKKAMLNAFFDKFKDEIKDFRLLLDFLKRANTYKEDKINPLTEGINQIIEAENQIVLKVDFEKQGVLKQDKAEMESLLADRIKTLKVIEKDYSKRVISIGILNDLIDNGGTLSDLRVALNDPWLLSTFIVCIAVHSNHAYDIKWIDDMCSSVELEIGE